ncbi:DUF6414 family protein [Vreelandella sedimenti]|uniref:DUF6414 family protein n=1 Tax=Vreelandella sedimenti TaxID=2729618 RepID=UPI0025801DB9|nr:hypothetical protein [Halomonas sp. UBA3173]|tara:strand:+ start:54184 stop:55122 length:939 start_codon:yes stop_codon:yes gene_type:complete
MIKSFIYLDVHKMYSLSSQIFEGITEYVLNESSTDNKETESQKGPVGSGKILADVIKNSSKSTEKKFLNDYSFTVFEDYLSKEGKILDLSGPSFDIEEVKESIKDFSFVKVKSRAIFNDVDKITELFTEFNTIGEALAHMGAYEEIRSLKAQIEELKSHTNNRNEKSRLETEYKRLTNISKLAKDRGLYQDPKFMSDLALLTKYGFSDQFEIQQAGGDMVFTSCLKREFLREKEDLLVKKYSRKTEKEVVVFGVISQAFSAFEPNIDKKPDYRNMKTGLMSIVEHLTNIENSISGKQENEIVIDPIAAYFEV